jgi:hypothetical protein
LAFSCRSSRIRAVSAALSNWPGRGAGSIGPVEGFPHRVVVEVGERGNVARLLERKAPPGLPLGLRALPGRGAGAWRETCRVATPRSDTVQRRWWNRRTSGVPGGEVRQFNIDRLGALSAWPSSRSVLARRKASMVLVKLRLGIPGKRGRIPGCGKLPQGAPQSGVQRGNR